MIEADQNSYLVTQQDSSQITGTVIPKKPVGRPFQEVYVSPQELKSYLKDLSITYGCNYQEIYNTIQGVNGLRGESHFDLNAYAPNKYGGSYGPSQYLFSTFKEKCNGDYADYINPLKQLACQCKMQLNGEMYLWDSWCLQNPGNLNCQKRGFR